MWDLFQWFCRSPGTGACYRPPADEIYAQWRDAQELPTDPTAPTGEEAREELIIYKQLTNIRSHVSNTIYYLRWIILLHSSWIEKNILNMNNLNILNTFFDLVCPKMVVGH